MLVGPQRLAQNIGNREPGRGGVREIREMERRDVSLGVGQSALIEVIQAEEEPESQSQADGEHGFPVA